MRDPRKNPVPGDVLRVYGTTKEVVSLEQNERGTTTHVLMTGNKKCSISAWKAWAKIECEVIRTAN
jgi:hypothetical protein